MLNLSQEMPGSTIQRYSRLVLPGGYRIRSRAAPCEDQATTHARAGNRPGLRPMAAAKGVGCGIRSRPGLEGTRHARYVGSAESST